MSVVDELRLIAYQGERDGVLAVGRAPEWFGNLADRIDAEYVELPVDNDGVPINVGDTVYWSDWDEREVRRIEFDGERWKVALSDAIAGYVHVWPDCVTHERPDSLERIADDIDKWRVCAADKCDTFGIEEDSLVEFADRIRKMAKDGE